MANRGPSFDPDIFTIADLKIAVSTKLPRDILRSEATIDFYKIRPRVLVDVSGLNTYDHLELKKTIVLTVDAPVLGCQLNEYRNAYKFANLSFGPHFNFVDASKLELINAVAEGELAVNILWEEFRVTMVLAGDIMVSHLSALEPNGILCKL
ncbi:hypothetical protein SCUCBS95973_004463 [Sporothrix curviconia]|uniref:Uncharacterized protein n=1 Tax=Sporothrix curviconia TaxID=1260050 RepID=A0ABP0BQL6_9PEZI